MTAMNEEFFLNEEEKNDALNDEGQELNDEFLFDKKKFQTVIVQVKDGKENRTILDIDKFIEQYNNYSEKNSLLLWLKENNYKKLLIEQICNTVNEPLVSQLICAYWEAGFTDYKDLLHFIPHLLSQNFNVALEAYSAISGLDRPFDKEDAEKALQMIEDGYNDLPAENTFLIDEIKDILKSELSEHA